MIDRALYIYVSGYSPFGEDEVYRTNMLWFLGKPIAHSVTYTSYKLYISDLCFWRNNLNEILSSKFDSKSSSI